MKKIGQCLLNDSGDGRIILSVPKSIFKNEAWQMRDVITKKLFPAIHNGSYPAWGDDLKEYYQVELHDATKATELVTLIEEWVKENV